MKGFFAKTTKPTSGTQHLAQNSLEEVTVSVSFLVNKSQTTENVLIKIKTMQRLDPFKLKKHQNTPNLQEY